MACYACMPAMQAAIVLKPKPCLTPAPLRMKQVRSRGCKLNVRANASHALEEAGQEGKEVAEKFRIPVPSIRLPGTPHISALQVKQVLCGIIAGSIAGTLTAPALTLRTRVMAGVGGDTTKEVIEHAVKYEGSSSNLTKMSFSIGTARTAIHTGLQFFVFELVQQQYRKRCRDPNGPKVLPLPKEAPMSTVAGAVAGLVSTLGVYPFDVILDRVNLQKEYYGGFLHAIQRVVADEGIPGLYRGVFPALISMVLASAIGFYTYTAAKEWWQERTGNEEVSSIGAVLCGAVSAVVSNTLTYPLEVARKQISMSAIHATHAAIGSTRYSSLLEAISGILKHQGWSGFYDGFLAQLLMVVPMTALSFLVFETAKRILLAEGEERRDQVKG